jgi:hypothetical protein
VNVASRVPRASPNGTMRGRSMFDLSSDDLIKIADIFGVAAENVGAVRHPLEHECPAASIIFSRGGNVAAALASYLNHEFYHVGSELAAEFIYRDPNMYSFVDDTESGAALILTIREQPADFIGRLDEHRNEIHFVALHPEILFMMRPKMTYDAAKSCLQKGYELVL